METYLYDEIYHMENKHWWFVARREIIADMLNRFFSITKGLKILDIGCGTGGTLKILTPYGEIYGMDSSPAAVEYARRTGNYQIRLGSLPDNVPYADETFNLVTAFDVLEHIYEDNQAIIKIYSLLKNDGLFICTVPAYQFLWSNHDKVHHHYRRYTGKELKTKLLKAGFQIEKISYYNFCLFPIIAVLRLLKRILPSAQPKSDMKMLHPLLNILLNEIFASEKYLLRLTNLPFGVSLLAICSKNNMVL